MTETTKIKVDGREVEVPRDYTLLQACEAAGAEIPRFCYHERLSIAGNCRMCLVELKGAPKPIASCAWGVKDCRPGPNGEAPEVLTKSPTVKKAREGVMEFLLINHPLDCPICDQGGECDLQDQAMAYGRGGTRYDLNKRAVEDKNMGPLIKTIMTRCIQCTRCVRFVAEVAGSEEIGMINRGEDAEITTYLEEAVKSELSGNVIDLCPVGALTSKPYAFNARPWELKKTESIDVMDALGSHIRVDARGTAVMRFLPRINDEINEEWISDKTRFVWDGLNRQRLDRPYVRVGDTLTPVDWAEALRVSKVYLTKDASRIAMIAGDLACAESMKAALDLARLLGVQSTDCRQDGAKLGIDAQGASLPRETWLFNSTLAGVEEADALLLVGTNPRLEAAVFNARIRKAWIHNSLEIGVIGEPTDLKYDYTHIGLSPAAINNLGSFGDVLKSAKRPMIVVGQDVLTRSDGAQVLANAINLAKQVGAIKDGWAGFNILHTAAARVGGLDMGFRPGAGGRDVEGILQGCEAGEIDTVFLLGADEIDMSRLGDAKVIYLGTHGDAGAHRADVILPGAAYTEKSATYVNTEGRVQETARAVFPKGEAREDWAILRALSALLHMPLPYDTLEQLRAKLRADHSSFAGLDFAPGHAGAASLTNLAVTSGKLGEDPIRVSLTDFYLTNPVARASKTMAECSAMRLGVVRSQAAE